MCLPYWTQNNTLYEHFQLWRAQVNHILEGPLHGVPEEQKVHYLCMCSGIEGNRYIEHFKAEGTITEENGKRLKTYWGSFDNILKTEGNPLIAVCQLKHLYQGKMSIDEFITNVTLLVDEAQYDPAHKERMPLSVV